jgi:hypothetical protein
MKKERIGCGMAQGEFDALIEKARITNRHRDETERQADFAVNSSLGPIEIMRTACFAIEAGVRTDDTNCLAEAFAMLDEEARRLRTESGNLRSREEIERAHNLFAAILRRPDYEDRNREVIKVLVDALAWALRDHRPTMTGDLVAGLEEVIAASKARKGRN